MPLTWDTKVLRETDVLPGVGSYIKKYNVARTKADPSASNPEDASWSAAGWASLAGMQMERIDAKARFKMLACPAALHVVVESQIPRKARLERFVRDGSVARNENVEIMIAPGERTDRRYRFVIGPLDGSLYDSRLGFVNDPRDPYYRKNDPRWNGDISITNTRDGDRWIMYARIPYATLAAAAPKPGSVWRVNVGRDTNKNIVPAKPGQMLWNPNLKSRWFSDPDAMGRLVFR